MAGPLAGDQYVDRLYACGAAGMRLTTNDLEEKSGVCIQVCCWQWAEVRECGLADINHLVCGDWFAGRWCMSGLTVRIWSCKDMPHDEW